ncbi:polysaccharide biosynthesis/export family protein [Altererythrobacter sp. MF3-039]|uniref:polysaccharide biosynthesis/export family protein n=1 Tax=Altererythrobacter sp. MF3-039 TaxID=3252901 RepID=UPI00390CBB19
MKSGLPTGAQSYAVIPATAAPPSQYMIGTGDLVSVDIYREPELSVEARPVDPSGQLVVPLIGAIDAAGMSGPQLSETITRKLAEYLVDPKVAVSVSSATQTVAVEGSVNQPGIYQIPGKSSLIESIALARSPTRIADLDEVLVFREIDGQRAAARFDLARIRAGLDPDPVILPGDRIVVGFSAVKEAWLEYLDTSFFNIFRAF